MSEHSSDDPGVPAQQQTVNFYYSWEDGFSTNPAWTRTADLVALCDGRVVDNVLACLTGPDGFLKILRQTNDGQVVLTAQREPAFQIRFGHVQVKKREKSDSGPR